MKTLFLLLVALILVGCKTEIDTKLKVVESGQFIVQARDGEKLRLPDAEIKGELVIDGKHPEKSFLKLFLMRDKKKFRPEIPLKLPNIDVLLGSNDPVKLDAKTIGQTFGMMVMREIRPNKDRFIMTFHDPDFNKSLAEMIFEYEPSKVLYDENKKEFLASYQKVKRKQRALIVKIDGDIDGSLGLAKKYSWLERTLDHIVNYGGAALISPWAYARYSSVKWIIGDKSTEEDDINKWKSAVTDYPVIDYFAFVHDGDQKIASASKANAESLSLKKNQLRAVYTGACYSKHGDEWLKDYGAVAAAGQNKLSASPLFQFTVLRRWVYGFNFEKSLILAYNTGVATARTLEFITFAKFWEQKTGMLAWKSVDEMLASSEILFSYTQEIPAKNVSIGHSAILSGIPFDADIIKKGVIEAQSENNGEVVIQKSNTVH